MIYLQNLLFLIEHLLHLLVNYIFLIIFMAMLAYFVYFLAFKSDDFINNEYNGLQTLFEEEVVC